jgi:hypothetical protein
LFNKQKKLLEPSICEFHNLKMYAYKIFHFRIARFTPSECKLYPKHKKMEVESQKLGRNAVQSGSVYGIFKNHKDTKKTIELILGRGYELDEIVIFPPDMGNLIPNATPNHFPKGDEVMKESLKGLRNGAVIGLILAVVGVGIYILSGGEFENASLLFGAHSVIVLGAISGSVMGFFINPHLPKPFWRFFSKYRGENKVTVIFEPHNMVDAVYFSEKGRLKVAQ